MRDISDTEGHEEVCRLITSMLEENTTILLHQRVDAGKGKCPQVGQRDFIFMGFLEKESKVGRVMLTADC